MLALGVEKEDCSRWAGGVLVECSFRSDGSLERIRKIEAREVYRAFGEYDLKLTPIIGETLIRDGRVTQKGKKHLGFIFPYTTEERAITLILDEGQEKKPIIHVEKAPARVISNVYVSVLLGVHIVLYPVLVYWSRVFSSRGNKRNVRRFGYFLLAVCLLFFTHMGFRIYEVSQISYELLFWTVSAACCVVGWFLGRIHARRNRFALDCYGRPMARA